MTSKELIIRLGNCFTHQHLIQSLTDLFDAQPGDHLELFLDLNTSSGFIYPDYLLLIASAVYHAESQGAILTGQYDCHPRCEDYLSRMNFFDNIGIQFDERFARRDAAGRFLEISRFVSDRQANEFVNQVVRILRAQFVTDESILATLSLCLAELVGNVLEHSLLNEGWMVAQYYPKKRKIRIMVADTGQGIHNALTTNPKDTKYRTYTHEQAIDECIIKGVTNGSGLGNGLYATANLVRENGGHLMIHSDDYMLSYTQDRKQVNQTHRWKGTVVFLELNSNIPVRTELILDGYTDFVDDFQDWFCEEPVENLDNLW